MEFFDSLTKFERRKTGTVRIGNLLMGGEYPIRIQSMTTTDTLDTESSVAQCKRIFDAGADLVRLTAQGIREAENLSNIRKRLTDDGYLQPLVADIHFNPNAAEAAACYVEKVRINPGNFVDKRASFVEVNLSEKEYAEELERLRVKFIALLDICSKHQTALRIGVNHGSLSDRIMSRYGDTPEGMVESAMEFLRICTEHSFTNVVLSMKASNVRVMVHAYRLLVKQMKEEGMMFPLHLGVTEAGEGEDGRIKSAVGIGTLLADGIGDTIRVSLTEEPEAEIPVAKTLSEYFTGREMHNPIASVAASFYHPYEYTRAISTQTSVAGGDTPPIVIADLSGQQEVCDNDIIELGYQFSIAESCWKKAADTAPDIFYLGSATLNTGSLHGLKTANEDDFIFADAAQLEMLAEKAKRHPNSAIILETSNSNGVAEQRAAILYLKEESIFNPIIIRRSYNTDDASLLQLKAAADCGPLFIDGLADGIMISNKGRVNTAVVVSSAFSILQAARVRISKTEFISCPGCGRTLFELQHTAARIRERTKHLTGLKIGIMGCIVNGPGEMADADYGYVGAGPGKVTLYKGKTAVKKSIPQDEAIEQLVNLIKENGDWRD